MAMSENGLAVLRRHEGFRDRVYIDTVGKRTVGYGWNIDDTPMYREAANIQMKLKLEEIEAALLRLYDWYPNLSQARRDVVLNMSYNLGVDGFDKFQNTIYLLANSKFLEASQEMLKSKWAKQVGNRAITLSEAIKNG